MSNMSICTFYDEGRVHLMNFQVYSLRDTIFSTRLRVSICSQRDGLIRKEKSGTGFCI